MIKRLAAFDFDGTLMNSPEKENGIQFWQDKMGYAYPHIGWWGRPESLNMDVFEIKPFPSVLAQLEREKATPDTMVIVLTSRMEKLRPHVTKVLDANNISVDKLDMKKSEKTKGEKILDYIKAYPDLSEISVFDDRIGDIEGYEAIRNQIPEGIVFNIYVASKGSLALSESKLESIIKEEIHNFTKEDGYLYHGTYDGAGVSIQRDGRMKINAAGNNEPFISFTSMPDAAKYYANMKGGASRGIILRIKKTSEFQLSPKFRKKDNGFEWITTREIPINEIEINTKYGWIPLNDWDFIDKEIKK